MKTLPVFMFATFAAFAFAGEKDVSLTVYSNNLALVREVRMIQLPKGASEVRFTDVAAAIDPTSVHFKSLTDPENVDLIEQNFEYDLLNPNTMLQKYIDQEITVHTEQDGPFQGRLLSASPNTIMLQMQGGSITSIAIDPIISIDYPALSGGVITKPTMVWLINSQRAGEHKAEASYLTADISWHAEYVAVCKKNDGLLELSSWVSIDNQSGADYENAKLKLIAGDVHRAIPAVRPMAKGLDMMAEQAAAPRFEERPFSEYHLYTLSRRISLKNNQKKQIALFPPAEIKADKIYCYNGALYGEAVRVTLAFQNSKGSGPGIPLPKGKVRVYKHDDADNSSEFVGEDLIAHTPQDEKVRIYLGNALDIKGERVQKEMKQLSERSHEETWQIILRNHKKEAVTVIVEEQLQGDWKIRRESLPHKKKDAATIEFEVPVEKDGEAVLEYTGLFKW